MPRISFITTCMGRLDHLQQSLPTWLPQPDSEVVVVDYSCPQRSGDWVELAHPGVQLVRVPGETFFNLSKARNAGAKAASGRWLCFVDADVRLAPEFSTAVAPLLGAGCFLRVEQGAPIDLVGTALISQEAFTAVGGYDDVLEGWGAEDYDIYLRLQHTGQLQTAFPARLLEAIPHGDELRTQHAAIRNRLLGWNVNRLYIEGKVTLWRLLGKPPALKARQSLYALIRRAVTAGAAQKEVRVELALGLDPRVTAAEVEYSVVLVLKNPAGD